mmetsp:Transcript_24105/g.37036  ORF Transcript_24105/g.37036 Transcript_24105/m.37036 type:complete len:83 (-) Transcript_24105:266-514(-)
MEYVKQIEDKYLEKAKENLEGLKKEKVNAFVKQFQKDGVYGGINFIRLQNFSQKVFVIGLFDDPIIDMLPLPEALDKSKGIS